MRAIETIVGILATGALLFALSACESNEGPAEKAGKRLDTAVENLGEQMDKAGAEIQEAVDGDKQ